MIIDLWHGWNPADADAPVYIEEPVDDPFAVLAMAPPATSVPLVRPHTDLGNCERLVDQYGAVVSYVGSWRKWLIWDGRRWVGDDNNLITYYAKQTVRSIAREVPGDAGHAKWAQRSEADARISAMVRLASSEPAVAISPDQLDANDAYFTCGNGTIDLRTGRLLPHDPTNLCTKMTTVEFAPGAACPAWLKFLDDIFEGNEDLKDYVKRAVGYSATASTREQVMFVLTGGGSNGKSTFLEILRLIFGDFSQQMPASTLLEKRGSDSGPNNDVARLRGARFAAAVETAEEGRLAEAQVKSLTGGDTVTARYLHAEFFEFVPEAKIWLATNHKPRITGSDDGIWRRLRLIPFNRKFSDEEKDLDLKNKLLAELPGILQWVIEGALEWQAHGLGTASAVRDATREYKTEQDTLGRFLEEETLSEAPLKISANHLYAAYSTWATNAGEKVESQKAFGTKLTERGLEKSKHGPERRAYYFGIGLKPNTPTGQSPF